MNLLLVYLSISGGHRKVVEYIKKAAKGNNKIKITELDLLNKPTTTLIRKLYFQIIYSMPFIYQLVYDNYLIFYILSPLRNIIYFCIYKSVEKRLKKLMPEYIVCVHCLAVGTMAYFKKNHPSSKLIALITDIYPNIYWINKYVDYYLVPTIESKEFLIKKINTKSKKNIISIGIPIDSSFYKKINKEYLLEKLKLQKNKKTILIMGGYFGLISKNIIKNIIFDKELIKDCQIVLIVAKNEKLGRKITKWVKNNKNIQILGYVENVDEYMKVADLLITKAGGVTLAEASATSLNILLVNTIPGQERRNARYLTERGYLTYKKNISIKQALNNYQNKKISLGIDAAHFLKILCKIN